MHLRVQSRTLNLMFSGACIFKFNLWLWTQVPSLTLNSSSTSIFELWYLSVTVYKSDCFHVHFMTKLSYTHTHEWRSIWNNKCGKKWIYKTNNWQSYVLSDDVCIKHTKYNRVTEYVIEIEKGTNTIPRSLCLIMLCPWVVFRGWLVAPTWWVVPSAPLSHV